LPAAKQRYLIAILIHWPLSYKQLPNILLKTAWLFDTQLQKCGA